MGGAWIIGALRSLARRLDWDPRTATVLQGTSAGAEISMLLGSGYSVDDLVEMHLGTTEDSILAAHIAGIPGPVPPRPASFAPMDVGLFGRVAGYTRAVGLLPPGGGRPEWLRASARALESPTGWTRHPDVRLCALDLESGTRVPFGASGAPLARLDDAVAAAWAIPGWMEPVTIAGNRYVDGGSASTASVDLLFDTDVEEVLVIAPMASLDGERVPGVGGMVEGILRRALTSGLAREVHALRSSGRRVTVVDADAASLRTLGPNFMARGRRGRRIETILADADARVETVLQYREELR